MNRRSLCLNRLRHSVPCRAEQRHVRCCTGADDDEEQQQQREQPPPPSLLERVQSFLDTPILDPQQESKGSEPKLLRDFRDMLNSDYEMAETLFVRAV